MSAVLLRYLAREIFAATALVLVAFLGLFAFFDFINELEDVGKGGYTLYQAVVYVGLTLPARFYELIDVRAVFHRPHPRKETNKGAVKSVRRFLESAGVKP